MSDYTQEALLVLELARVRAENTALAAQMDRPRINRVRLASNEYQNNDRTVRCVDQIEVHVMDMWLRKDITSERDEYLAQRLAEEAGVELEDFRDGPNAPEPLTRCSASPAVQGREG